MLECLDTYDCAEAFKFADQPDPVPPGTRIDTSGFTREDVQHVFALDEGENDGRDFLCVGQLKDGRLFVIDAWRDYTGWDCCGKGTSSVALTLADAMQFGLTESQREQLHNAVPQVQAA